MSHSNPIRADDPVALERLQEEIAEAEHLQTQMKLANKIVRDQLLTDDEKVGRLGTQCALPPLVARGLLKPDFAGRVGFPDYKLTNNSANIRRMQARVAGLTKEEARPSLIVEFPGGHMLDSAETNRVRIYYDEKPARDVIVKLKANGFHWSPTVQCWQRLRNEAARLAAAQITGENWSEPRSPVPPSVAVVPLNPTPQTKISP